MQCEELHLSADHHCLPAGRCCRGVPAAFPAPGGETLRPGALGLEGKKQQREGAASSPPCADSWQFFIFLEEKALPSEQERNKD